MTTDVYSGVDHLSLLPSVVQVALGVLDDRFSNHASSSSSARSKIWIVVDIVKHRLAVMWRALHSLLGVDLPDKF